MSEELKSCIEAVGRVVSEEGIAVYFQPLVSIPSKGVVGFEAFSRGVDENGSTLANAACLFNESLPQPAQHKVEELCLKKSLVAYKPIYEKYFSMLLFLNVNAGLYSKEEIRDYKPLKYLEAVNYNPRMVVFEFDATQLAKSAPIDLLRKIKSTGYRISIDNSDLSRGCREQLFMVKPDFIKIDRSQYKGIDTSGRIRELYRFVVGMFKQAGVMPIAKGVETAEEAVSLVKAGITVQQGFYYSDKGAEGESLTDRIARVNSQYRELKSIEFKKTQETFSSVHLLLKKTISRLQQEEVSRMTEIIDESTKKTPELIAAFIVNESGKQLSKVIIGQSGDRMGLRVESTAVGSDHSLEEYFMYINSGMDKCSGLIEFSAFCREKHRYVAGHFYRDGTRKGNILVLFYTDNWNGDKEPSES